MTTPFGEASEPVLLTEWAGAEVAFLSRHGPGHLLNPSQVPHRANIFALKTLGVTHIISSGACGSLREQIEPRELVVPNQVIDKTHQRAGTFFDEGLAVHVEFAQPFCPHLRKLLVEVNGATSFSAQRRSRCQSIQNTSTSGAAATKPCP